MPAGLTDTIVERESKGLSNEKINFPITSNHSLSPNVICMYNSRMRVRFKGSYLKQYKVTFTPKNVVNLFTVYELDRLPENLNAEFTLKNCFFGAAKVTKNADPDKYSYSRCGIGFSFTFFISKF